MRPSTRLALCLGVTSALLVAAPPALAHRDLAAAKTTRVRVLLHDGHIALSRSRAPRGVVVFRVRNDGSVTHDFRIAGRKTPLLAPGERARLRVRLKKGKYRYRCTVPGHATGGMRGVFRVR